ncbi:hypothetical protein SDC9_121633 [bioreactor metagenome]|uniref:Uncharacterized protein n=1 Tax=bioreactor metagenome TaxID=1076179 RepID=A0A645CCJ1_9ZZZZ
MHVLSLALTIIGDKKGAFPAAWNGADMHCPGLETGRIVLGFQKDFRFLFVVDVYGPGQAHGDARFRKVLGDAGQVPKGADAQKAVHLGLHPLVHPQIAPSQHKKEGHHQIKQVHAQPEQHRNRRDAAAAENHGHAIEDSQNRQSDKQREGHGVKRIPNPIAAAVLSCDLKFFERKSKALRQHGKEQKGKKHRLVYVCPLGGADTLTEHPQRHVAGKIHGQPEDQHLRQGALDDHEAKHSKQNG